MALIGIAAGLIGSIITQTSAVFTLKEKRKLRVAEMAHEALGWDHEAELIKLASQGEVASLEMQVVLTQVKETFEGLKASMKEHASTAAGAHKWARSVSTLVRPLITIILLAFAFYYAYMAGEFIDGVDKVKTVVVTLTELTSMSVTWWFGDRSNKRINENSRAAGEIRAAGGDF